VRVSEKRVNGTESCTKVHHGQAAWTWRRTVGSAHSLAVYEGLTDAVSVSDASKERGDWAMSQSMQKFYRAVRAYYSVEDSLEGAFFVIESGITLLESANS
jgi:hypothetical protein